MAIFYAPLSSTIPITATRFASHQTQDFVLLTLPEALIDQSFPALSRRIRENLGLLLRWTDRDKSFYSDVVSPPVPKDSHSHWYLAKVLEILSLHVHHQPQQSEPLFCSVVRQNAHRYVREALSLLQAQLADPLDLKGLAGEIGCTPHYLSRLVKQETGKPLSHHLRAMRMEKAEELLANHQLNVTETALEVGYQSLSHFSKAFAQEKGITPSEFLRKQ